MSDSMNRNEIETTEAAELMNTETNTETNTEANTETIEHCDGCERCCPKDNLHCGRGRRFFALKDGEDGTRPGDERPHDGWDGGAPDFHGHHGDDRRPSDDDRRGPRDGHRRPFDDDRRDPHDGHRRPFDDDPRGPHGHRPPRDGWDGDAPRGPHGRRPDFRADDLEGLLQLSAHHLFHRRGGRRFGGAQNEILEILADEGGSADQKALQDELRIRPASISELLTKLEDKELITRTRSEEDHRRTIISLTAAGSEAAAKSRSEHPEDDLFAALTEEEQATLKDLLKKLIDSWH